MKRVGYYCWAGPGTIRMLKLKYFHPRIDYTSLMSSYNFPYLQRLKEVFGVTDFWATYSWGFSQHTEKEDYKFLQKRYEFFRQLGINLHVYIQGPNVVYEEFKERDWFCRDEKGRLISYHKGRKLTCLNNPGFREYLLHKIQQVGEQEVHGIFIDNIQQGQLGLPHAQDNPFVFFGCACSHCRSLFKQRSGYDIPRNFAKAPAELIKEYAQFRVDTVSHFIQEASQLAHAYHKTFGTNSFDPRFDTRYCYGTDLHVLHDMQDYLLFENHSLPTFPHKRNNLPIRELSVTKGFNKPIFVVSYKRGIGFDSHFSQRDIDHIFTEASLLSYAPCLKGSEFFSKKQWHNLYIDQFQIPKIIEDFPLQQSFQKNWKKYMYQFSLIRYGLRQFTNPLMTGYMEKRWMRTLLKRMHISLMK